MHQQCPLTRSIFKSKSYTKSIFKRQPSMSRITSVLYYLRCQVHLFSKIHSAFNFYSKKVLFEPFPNVRDSVFSHYPLRRSLNKHDSDGSENVIQKVNLLSQPWSLTLFYLVHLAKCGLISRWLNSKGPYLSSVKEIVVWWSCLQ